MVGKFFSVARTFIERTEVGDNPDFASPATCVDDGPKCIVAVAPQMLRTSLALFLALDVFFFLDVVHSSKLHEREARLIVASGV
jgi:hypothetical protein